MPGGRCRLCPWELFPLPPSEKARKTATPGPCPETLRGSVFSFRLCQCGLQCERVAEGESAVLRKVGVTWGAGPGGRAHVRQKPRACRVISSRSQKVVLTVSALATHRNASMGVTGRRRQGEEASLPQKALSSAGQQGPANKQPRAAAVTVRTERVPQG